MKPRRPGAISVWSLSGAAILLAISVALIPIIFPGPGDGYELNKWEEFAGNMHFVVLHIPIGIFVWVFILELLGVLSFGKYKPATALPLFFGVVFGVIAVVLGYYLYLSEGSQDDLITKHMWGSIAFVVLGALSYMTKISSLRTGTTSPVYVVMICATMATMVVAAHWGGESVHGNLLAPLEREDPKEKEPEEAPAEVVPVPELLAYEQVVVPILESKCYACHSVDKKKKGKLLMDTYEDLLKGGAEAPALVPGDLEESLMMVRIHIPIDDDPDEERMPPADKEQLTAEEIAILDWWVKTGAPQQKSLQDAEAPEEILKAAEQVMAVLKAPVAEPPKEADPAEEPKVDPEEAKREALKKAVAGLKEKFGGALNFVSQESSELHFNAVGIRKDFGDEQLASLADVGESIIELNLSGTMVTDAGMAKLAGMPNLKKLRLNDTAVTDEGLAQLKGLPQLEFLVLFGTQVTDAGMAHLKEISSLKKVFVGGTGVTEAGVTALQEGLPEAEVNGGI